MFKIKFFFIFCIKIFHVVQSKSLLISDVDLDSLYIHRTDISRINIIESSLKLERKTFCSIDRNFIEQIIFGLITDDHKLMKKCFEENQEKILNLSNQMNHFIVYNISSKFLNDYTQHSKYVAIRRAKFTVDEDYLYFIKKSMIEIETVCMRRLNNTLDGSYYAEQIGTSLATGNLERSIENYKMLKVPALIISSLKFAMNWNAENVLQNAMNVFNGLLKDNEMEAASTMLVTIFGIFLKNNQKNSYEMLIIAEKTKIALEKFVDMSLPKLEYKKIRNKFKFIIVHLPAEIRSFVWDIPGRQTNYCIKNKRFQTFLFVFERQRQRKLLTGNYGRDSGSDFLKQRIFRINFNQADYFHKMESDFYNDAVLTHTANELKDQPERWFFEPIGDGTFLIKTEVRHESEKSNFLYLVDNVEEKKLPRNVKLLSDYNNDLKNFNGAERWTIDYC